MIVDENLNDCSNEIIDSWKALFFEKKRQYTLIICILGFITILNLTLALVMAKIADNKERIIEELSIKIKQDESILSLEYSIGSWFINTPEEVNDSTLYQFLLDNNAWYPDILLKQAKIESGNYTSNVYRNSCNLYGMRKVGKRNTTQRGVYNGYGVYDNWCLSVLDRMLWDVFYFKNKKPTEEEYLKAMSVYAEDENYINKLLN